MPKFSLDINGVDQEAFEGYEVWSGPTPKPGVYEGKLKVAQITVIDPEGRNKSTNAGKNRVKIGVELAGNTGDLAQYNGFTAWGGVNLVESGIGFVNQWLLSLTDGSDEEFERIKVDFYGRRDSDGKLIEPNKIIVDEKKEHIVRIGSWKVESPNGELPIKVSLTTRQRNTTDEATGVTTSRTNVDLKSFLVRDGATSTRGGFDDDGPVEEAEIASVDDLDDLDNDETSVGEAVDESVFDDVPEPANAE